MLAPNGKAGILIFILPKHPHIHTYSMNDDDDGQQRRSVNPYLILSAGATPPPPFPPAATVAPATAAAAANDDEDEALPAAARAAAAPKLTACHPLDVLQVGEVWRRGLKGLAQSLKCPICLGYVVIRGSSLSNSNPSLPFPSIVCEFMLLIPSIQTSVKVPAIFRHLYPSPLPPTHSYPHSFHPLSTDLSTTLPSPPATT